jgi:hypothetical protein
MSRRLTAVLVVAVLSCGREILTPVEPLEPTQPIEPGSPLRPLVPIQVLPTPDLAPTGNRAPEVSLKMVAPVGRQPRPNENIVFDASASRDPEGTPLTFAWQVVSSSEGVLSSTVNGVAFFYTRATQLGRVTARVRVTDADGVWAESTLEVQVMALDGGGTWTPPPQNTRPVALIRGAPTPTIMPGGTYTLDATGSYDPDGDALLFAWRLLDRPYGSAVSVMPTGGTSAVTVDLEGDYVIELTVTDARGLSATAQAVWFATSTGQRCRAPAQTWGTADPAGDVSLSNADVVRTAAAIENGKVDLRVQLCGVPFPFVATHFLDWCVELDNNMSTGGACGYGNLIGADTGLHISRGTNGVGYAGQIGGAPLDVCNDVTFDPLTNTLRVLFDASRIGSPISFNYVLTSTFGGSFGANEWLPQAPTFGTASGRLTTLTTLPPFNGISLCAVRP